jgi:aspartate beta-hydroxylase
LRAVRSVVHLALIVPPDCGFRVGAESRQWREGAAWVFDDTIEHEAWNDSNAVRGILIVDCWNPLTDEGEREQLCAVLEAFDVYYGRVLSWDDRP